VATGVYVANLPSKTRDEIWDQVVEWSDADTRAILLWPSPANEQGLEWLQIGEPRRRVVDHEGLLVSTWIPRGTDDDATEQVP
jgi:CRISPR-associated endoribonuclease Cas2 subtype I-E